MLNDRKENLEFKALLAQIDELLTDIKKEQINERKIVEQNHKVNMKKFTKLIDYCEICDMTNKIFEKRISNIEKILYEVFKS